MMYTATVTSQHHKASKSRMSTLRARSILRIDLAADSELLESKIIASRSRSSLNVKDNIPKTAWEVCK